MKIRTLLDSGSDLSLIKKEKYDRISWKGPLNYSKTRLQAANGQTLNVANTAELTFKIDKAKTKREYIFDLQKMRVHGTMIDLQIDRHVSAILRLNEDIVLTPGSINIVKAKVRNSDHFSIGETYMTSFWTLNDMYR